MKCDLCRKKCIHIHCNYCKNQYCSNCIQFEIHNCQSVNVKKQNELDNLRSNLTIKKEKKDWL